MSCRLYVVPTLPVPLFMFQMVYSLTLPAQYTLGGTTGTNIVGNNLALNALANGCCTITRIA